MFDIKKKAQFATVEDLRKLLETVSDSAKVFICGEDGCYFHCETDESLVCLDCDEIDWGYEKKGGDTIEN